MLVFMGVFAFGETLMQPTIPAISNDLAVVYVDLMVLGCLGIFAMAGALERRIPATVNGVAADEPIATTPTERS
jgi:hypothetical protein